MAGGSKVPPPVAGCEFDRRGGSQVRAGGGAAATGQVEQMLSQVAPGRYDAYEALLQAVADGQVWMLLWHGQPGSPDAQYGNMDVSGYGYAPCVTSPQELAASGWNRSHEIVSGRTIAASLFRNRWGLWLNPHSPRGGVGIPWLDLRRIASGLDRLPAGPLQLSEPTVDLSQFYAQLTQAAQRTMAVRTLRRAWVRPALGDQYLAIGLDLFDSGPQALESVRQMMQQAIASTPEGLPVSTVAMADDYDPVAMWMRAYQRPFYDRTLASQPQPAWPPQQPGPPPPAWGPPRY